LITGGRVVEAGCVANECIKTNRRVGVAVGVAIERVITNGGVVDPGKGGGEITTLNSAPFPSAVLPPS
jgi:hypothetical protein